MYFDKIAEAVAPMFDKFTPPLLASGSLPRPAVTLIVAAVTLVTSVVGVHANHTSTAVPTQTISDCGAFDNVFRIMCTGEDEIVQGHTRVLELKREE